jgi:hypothetical protein
MSEIVTVRRHLSDQKIAAERILSRLAPGGAFHKARLNRASARAPSFSPLQSQKSGYAAGPVVHIFAHRVRRRVDTGTPIPLVPFVTHSGHRGNIIRSPRRRGRAARAAL